jgi:hypothetical protein
MSMSEEKCNQTARALADSAIPPSPSTDRTITELIGNSTSA